MIYDDIERLIDYALKIKLITNYDIYVVRNQFMDVLQLTDWEYSEEKYSDGAVDDILAPLVDYACEKGIIPDTTNSRDLFDTRLMGIVTPMPREVNAHFTELYKSSPPAETDWYYEFSKRLNYIRAERMKKDLRWKYPYNYGVLDVTINRQNPRKTLATLPQQGQLNHLRIQSVCSAQKTRDLREM